LIWQNGVLELDFSQTLRLFRYFPEHLHTQQTGLIMTAPSVSVRVPSPSNAPESLHVQLSVLAGESLSAADLTLDGVTLSFESTIDGGQWSGQVPVTGALIDLRLDRSPRLATIHRNTTLQLTHEPPH